MNFSYNALIQQQAFFYSNEEKEIYIKISLKKNIAKCKMKEKTCNTHGL